VMPKDVAGTLAAVAELGYDGVELAGLHNVPARELRAPTRRSAARCWWCPGSASSCAATGPGLRLR
jgi:hypothetical protein